MANDSLQHNRSRSRSKSPRDRISGGYAGGSGNQDYNYMAGGSGREMFDYMEQM